MNPTSLDTRARDPVLESNRAKPANQPARPASAPAPDRSAERDTAATPQAVEEARRATAIAAAVDPGKLKAAVEATNQFLQPVANSLKFEVDQDSGNVLVKVVDVETNKVLRQIPSAEALAISKALDRYQGVFLKQEA